MFKRAAIPASNGLIQHDVVITTDRRFYHLTDGVVALIYPYLNGQVFLNQNTSPTMLALFQTTFPDLVVGSV